MENQKERYILGVDLNKGCMGVAIAKYDGETVDMLKVSHIKTKSPYKGTTGLLSQATSFKKEFIEKYKDIGITDIVIEEPPPYSEHNNEIASLLRYNGMISMVIYEVTGIVPRFITSRDARKYAFPDLMSVRKYGINERIRSVEECMGDVENNTMYLFGSYPFKCDKKYIIWNKISEMFPDIKWEYDKNELLKTENFVVSDSIVSILGYINKEKYEEDKPKITNFTKKEFDGNTRIDYTMEFCGEKYEKFIQFESLV